MVARLAGFLFTIGLIAVAVWFCVIEPVIQCKNDGGTPVKGVIGFVCIKPSVKGN